nr:zinc finger, CCHC-type [Tanacetum cinerariifolium]
MCLPANEQIITMLNKITKKFSRFTIQDYLGNKVLEAFLQGDISILLRFVNDKVTVGGYRQVKILEFFDCLGPRQGAEDLRGLLNKQRVERMASMNTRLNIKKLDRNIVQKHGGSKQAGFKQLGPGVETGFHGLHDEKRVWFEVELQEAQGDRKAEVFQVSNDDTAVAQRRLEDKQPEEKTNIDWDTTRSTYLVNRSPSSAIGFKKPIDILGVFCWLASIKQGMLEPVKVKCILLGYHKSIAGNKIWWLDDVTSKVVLYRNIDFNESWEYTKTFIGTGVGTDSVHVLQGVEFEVEPHEDHAFEVEPQGNVDHVAGSQEIQTYDLMDYHSTRDKEQHSSRELLGYREDNNEAAFVKAVLKKDMDARSDVYVLSNGCRKSINDRNDYYWEFTPGMFIHLFLYIDDMVFSCGCKDEIWATKGLLDKAKGNVLGMEIARDQSGNTLRVSQSRFYDGKLVQTLLEGHYILSLNGSLSVDCDVENNDVGMLDKFDHGLQIDVQVFVDFDYAMGRSITIMELRYELRLVAGIATGALVKGSSRSEVPAQVEIAAYRY